jgi:hypothetical protein
VTATAIEAAQRYRSSIRPIRVFFFDDRMHVRVRLGVGHRAACTCGFLGPKRRTVSAARADRRHHDAEHDAA